MSARTFCAGRARGCRIMDPMSPRTLALLSLAFLACGDDQQAVPDAMPDAVDFTIGEAPELAMPCADAAGDLYTLPSDLPAMDDSHRGDVFRCSVTEKLTIPEIQAQITADNAPYMNTVDGTINSGFWTYRIAYRTERNTVGTARAEGDTAATLIIPANPLPGGPLVVFGHGSSGIAPQCAASRLDLSAAIRDEDYPPMLWRLAGYGYTVIAPDYTGFAYGQAPGYFNAEDEAHAMLDATRAAAKLLPTAPAKVVFVGHSQGGHAALAAQSYAESYGMAGELAGVATFAPLWSSMSLWAAAVTSTGNLTTAVDTNAILYAMEYAYSAGELRVPGSGVSVFQTDKQTAAKDVILNECYDAAGLQALGATPADFFDMDYVTKVGAACAIGNGLPPVADCSDPLAMDTWVPRWKEDRPAIDATSAPILAFFGGMDTVLPPYRAACARDKIDADLAAASGATTTVEYCNNPNAGHRDITRGTSVDYVNEWIAARAGAGPEPASCTPFAATVRCAQPPIEH